MDKKIDDFTNPNDLSEDAQIDISTVDYERLPGHILLPDSSDVKPKINSMNDIDPIQISTEEKKPVEELRRELLEFELKKQKELFDLEKQHKKEKHEMEMSILMIRKQILTKELNNS